jgi:surface protein
MLLSGGFTATFGLTFTTSATPTPPAGGNLVMTFNTALATTNPGNVYLPLGDQFGVSTVNATIDWADGNTELATTAGIYSHTYASNGIYQVAITGAVSAYGYPFGSGENEPLVSVDSWDDGLGLTNMFAAFYFANNLIAVPNTLPSTVHLLNSAFAYANTFNQNLNGWDTSNVSGWDQVFQGASAFNGNIALWNISYASAPTSMFADAISFNQDISGWNTSNAFYMNDMFNGATNFNQDISSWDVGNVIDMNSMFSNAQSFNQNLSSWITGLSTQPVNFSLGANATFADNASNLKPYLSGGTVRINT